MSVYASSSLVAPTDYADVAQWRQRYHRGFESHRLLKFNSTVTGNWFPTCFGSRKCDEHVCEFESRLRYNIGCYSMTDLALL